MTEATLDTTIVRQRPRYSEYTHVDRDWLAEVPAHWDFKRLKWTATACQNGMWGDDPTGDDDDIGCVRVADFDRDNYVVTNDIELTKRSIPKSKRNGRVLRRGDLLLEKSGGGDLQPVGALVLFDSDAEAVCSNFVARVVVADGYSASFLRYLHVGLYAARLNTRSMKQATGIQNLDSNQYFDEKVGLPPLGEQQTIATFLDRATARIDELIGKKERLIALLEEKRQAVISHAVTRGVNPNAMLVDSGCRWVRRVPEHWKVLPLRRISVRVDVGIAEAATHAYRDAGVPIIRSTNVRRNYVDTEDMYYIDPEFAARNHSKFLNAGDLVTTRTGANLGMTAVVPNEYDQSQCFTLLVATLLPPHVPEFFSYWMNSTQNQYYFEVEGWGAGQHNLSVPIIQRMPVPIPPPDEQKDIVDYIDRINKQIKTGNERIRDGIRYLKEYRTALISAAVTGQIDVREEVSAQHD